MSKRTAAILVENEVNDLEFWYPYYRMIEEDMDVTIVGPEADTVYKGIKAEMSSSEAAGRSWDLLIVPGGGAPTHMIKDASMLDIVNKMNAAKKPIAAICHGTVVLCEAGAVDGVQMTCPGDVNERAKKAGAVVVSDDVYSAKRAIVDGNMITARGPQDLPAFCKAILSKVG